MHLRAQGGSIFVEDALRVVRHALLLLIFGSDWFDGLNVHLFDLNLTVASFTRYSAPFPLVVECLQSLLTLRLPLLGLVSGTHNVMVKTRV